MRKIGKSNLSRIRLEKCKTRKDFNLRVLVLLFRRRKLLTVVTNVTSVTNVTKSDGQGAESTCREGAVEEVAEWQGCFESGRSGKSGKELAVVTRVTGLLRRVEKWQSEEVKEEIVIASRASRGVAIHV